MPVSDWIAAGSAAGFDVSRLSLEQLYDLWGRIIHDTLLRKAALKKLKGCVLPAGARNEVLRSMSEAQRTEFRRRISD